MLLPSRREVRIATVEKISIALPPEKVAGVRAAVESGEYASASEVVREALRAWSLKRKFESLELAELKRLVQQGIDSGSGMDAEEVFARLRAKYAAMSTLGGP